MAQYEERLLSIEQTASFLGVSPATVRRRLVAGELTMVRSHAGERMVRLRPYDDWLRVEDAAGLLELSTAAVRARIQRGELAGKRVGGRWRVLLAAVLDDGRVNRQALALFGGQQTPQEEPAEPVRRPAARMRKDVFVRLDEEECALLEQARARHGSNTAAIAAGLRADAEQPVDVDQAAELRVELETTRGALHRTRAEHDDLRARARAGLVDELYCPACERLIPVEEFRVIEIEDREELHHGAHRPRQDSKLRRGTAAGRRARVSG